MKLKTLIEYQRCYDILRAAERACKPVSPEEYVDCLTAQTRFDFELELAMKGNEVAVTEADGVAA